MLHMYLHYALHKGLEYLADQVFGNEKESQGNKKRKK